VSNKSKSTTFLLCYFLGGLGVHRFYLGKLITGILMLLTGGGLLIWWLVDLYLVASGKLKDKEGNDLRTAQPYADQPNAGFWVRLSALMVDGLVLGVIQFIFIYLPFMAYLYNLGLFNVQDPEMIQGAMMSLAPIIIAVQGATLLLYVGYFVVLTAGKHQGTIGKRSMGIYVRKRDGGRIWFGSSVVRFVGYIISWIPFGLGYVMAAFQKQKLALHDIIAGTEVVYGTASGEAAEVQHEMADEFEADLDQEAVTEVSPSMPDFDPDPLPVGMSDARPSRVPEILVGTGLLLIAGSMALMYLR
jgi:uncharacterized RDD family membrane protein YckC